MNTKLFAIECGNFMVDGGAMFGVVPKEIWKKKYISNENNLCNITTRSLLIDTGERKILIDTGIGTRLPKEYLMFQQLNGDKTLISSLKEVGYTPNDITDIILTHLHFDHCGGTFIDDENKQTLLQFPNADIWVSRRQWECALNSNIREKPAYPDILILPLADSGKLRFIESDTELFPNVKLFIYKGHTDGLITVLVDYKGTKVWFVGDLIPVAANLPPVYLSAYDTYPLEAINEKEFVLTEVSKNNYYIMFQHDINIEVCTVTNTPRGFKIDKTLKLTDI